MKAHNLKLKIPYLYNFSVNIFGSSLPASITETADVVRPLMDWVCWSPGQPLDGALGSHWPALSPSAFNAHIIILIVFLHLPLLLLSF